MPIGSRSFATALAIAGAVLMPTMAHAQENEIAGAAKTLSDPQAQMAVAATLAALSQTLLDIRIEPFARAMRQMGDDSMADLPPDARLGDLAGRRARDVPADVARNVPRVMGSTAAMAGAVEQMLPELRQTARRMKDAIPRH